MAIPLPISDVTRGNRITDETFSKPYLEQLMQNLSLYHPDETILSAKVDLAKGSVEYFTNRGQHKLPLQECGFILQDGRYIPRNNPDS
jgi:hypothetical protein